MRRYRRLATPALLAVFGVVGCATLGGDSGKPSVVPTKFRTEAGPYAVFTNFPIPADDPAIRQLLALSRQVETTLGVRANPIAPPIEVDILDDRATFSHFLTFYHPEFPPRRAFFVAQSGSRVVYTYRQERLEEDLRHEATHALLNAAIGDVPLWLDEGLAEYFEVPEGLDGYNAEHMSKLPGDLETGWSPDLARLEKLKDVREMSPRDYREAWGWVHFMLDGPPAGKSALLAMLADLRSAAPDGPAPAALSGRLEKAVGDDSKGRMVTHLAQLRPPAPPIATRAPREATVRLQDAPAEHVAPKRRGFFSRLFGRGDAP
ncbi:MAG TPA: hypothetical protein VG406_30105 [Isosphaeraceae bacterium]|jgi:hypothetical protein|nr:hypothetical protein [Isosphaeraceae bacterium]